jgi:hypothetical protein
MAIPVADGELSPRGREEGKTSGQRSSGRNEPDPISFRHYAPKSSVATTEVLTTDGFTHFPSGIQPHGRVPSHSVGIVDLGTGEAVARLRGRGGPRRVKLEWIHGPASMMVLEPPEIGASHPRGINPEKMKTNFAIGG